MKLLYRVLSILLAVFTVFSFLPNPQLAYAKSTLTLNEAISYTKQNYADTKLKTIELVGKRIEYTEALEEIKTTRKEQRTVKFSLLFNLEFPEKTTLSKEYDLLSAIPQIESETRVIKKELEDLDRVAQNDAILQYTKTYCKEQELEFAEERYKNLKQDVEQTRRRVKSGVGDQKDLDSLEKSLSTLSTTVANLRQNVKDERKELSRLINQDSSIYVLENPLVEGIMSRDELDLAVENGIEKSIDVFKAESNLEYAEYVVRLLDDLYSAKWGGQMWRIRPYLYQDNVNLDHFFTAYEDFLRAIDAPWEKVYVIKLLFFKIRIPKLWIKGSRDGQRYFGDGKYPLVEAVNDREKAKEEYKQTLERTEASIRSAYNAMVQANKSTVAAKHEVDTSKKLYDDTYKLNLTGKASLGEVSSALDGYMSAQESYIEAMGTYAVLMNEFNLKSGGYLNDFVSKDLTFGTGSSGLSTKKEDKKSAGTYYVSDAVKGFTKSFSINLKEFEATDYELWYGKERRIGEKTSVTSPIIHISSAFSGGEKLNLYLYNDSELVGSAVIDQNKKSGDLIIKSVQKKEQQKQKESLGSANIERKSDDIISYVTVKPNSNLGAASFKITDKNNQEFLDGEPTPIDESFMYISVGVINPDDIYICFYDDNNKLLAKASLDKETNILYRED